MAKGTPKKEAVVEIDVESMLEKMTKVFSAAEVDFWSDCVDQVAVLAQVIKASPHLSDQQKVEKLGAMLDEHGYFTD
jgi:hypothetical protein